MLIWKCEQCVWQSKSPGGQGMGEALLHIRIGKREGTKHSCFLFDSDAQKPVLDTEGKVLKSLAKAQSLGLIPRGKEKEPKPIAAKEGGKLVTITGKQPAPVIFTIGELKIELDPQDLFESYIVYGDLKARGIVEHDSFAKVLKGSILYAWGMFVSHPVIEGDRVVLKEAEHG